MVHRSTSSVPAILRLGLAACLLATLVLGLPQPVRAASPDDGFNPGADLFVLTLALQPDGKILVGGAFSTLAGQTRNYIGRLNADGSLDAGFNPGANAVVLALALQPDGKTLVGGEFTTLDGQPRGYLGRLQADGTIDTGFNPGANGSVYALNLQADGKIVVGGVFVTLGGETRNRIGRLHADGFLDSTFNPGASSSVYALPVQPDGKLLVGGSFTSLGGQARSRIGRLSSDTAALQALSVADDGAAGQTITWTRSGASPEVWRVTFEVSTDGVTYTPLGVGTRTSGGWQLSGLTLPRGQNLLVRAQGSYAGGYFAGSQSLVESVRAVYLLPIRYVYLPLVLRH
ncbi:MAG: delta-60 repeat domain-containing protein [Anaerolineae bacterium]